MEKIPISQIRGKKDSLVEEGINDYLDEKTDPEVFINKDIALEETYENL